MTGAGAPGAPGIIKCLLQAKWINLTVGDCDADAIGSRLHCQFVQLPKATDAGFISTLLRTCKEKNINLILPLVTKELLPLAGAKNLLNDAGIKVLVSSPEAIELANNKTSCYQFLKEKGLAVPQFSIARTVEEFKQAVVNLGYPKKPLCFKPACSNGSRGFRVITDGANDPDILFNSKPNNTGITYAEAIRILSLQPFPELLVSEYFPGDEYTIDCIADQGKTKLIVPRLRIKMVNGISTAGLFVKDETIDAYCADIINALGLHGNVGIQVKRSASGVPLLLEINPRVQGTIVAALGAGVNLPLLAIKQEIGISIEPKEMNVAWGTKFYRYWTEVFS